MNNTCKRWASLLISLFLATQSLSQANTFANQPSKSLPNIIVILVDDMGFSDIGCFGGEIKTPNLDGLAQRGLRFTNFYNTGRCWPTRAALMTGYYAQQIGFDQVPGEPKTRRGPRPDWAPMLPARLAPMGYRSYHSGKWHLDGLPLASGPFDRSYLLKDQGRFFSPKIHWLDDNKLAPIPRGTDFYGTTAIADHAVETLADHQTQFGDQPFFHYVAFTAPHFPLHALPRDIEVYDGMYDVGWNEIRKRRWERIKSLGIVAGELSKVEPDVGPPYDFPKAIETLGAGEINRPLDWSQLTDLQKQFQADKMEIHAAMVHRVDIEIGRILDQLRSMKQLENTLLFFLSDNGASAEIMVRADGHDPAAPAGSADSYLCLGPGWSNACNTPFRRHKTWVYEGGIHTPMIAHWPQGISAHGKLCSTVGHVVDFVPTILDLVGAKENPKSEPAPPLAGISLKSTLVDNNEVERDSLWWLHEGNRALRIKNRKLVAAKNETWELFDLANDPTEQSNLALQYPEEVEQMKQEWNRQLESFRQNFHGSRRRTKGPQTKSKR